MPRIRDIESHLAAIKAKEPWLQPRQIDVIREIVFLRRDIDPSIHMSRFRALLDDGLEDLLRSFSTRWLVSLADTFADHGTEQERSNAMMIVMLANLTRLAETERLAVNDASVDAERLERLAMPGTPLWDGVVSYAIRHGDMPINMWTRARRILADTPMLLFIFETVLARMLDGDTVIGRLNKLNPNFCQLTVQFPYWQLVG